MRKPFILTKSKPTPRQRDYHGYDWSWRKLRTQLLRQRRIHCAELDLNICVDCAASGVPFIVPKRSYEADHIVPLQLAPQLKYKPDNIEFRCKSHHAYRSSLGNYLPRENRTVVCGLPASGKTTYVRKHASSGDLIWDADDVAQKKGFGPPPWEPEARQAIFSERQKFIRQVQGTDKPVWLIVTRVKVAHAIARDILARVILLEVPRDELERRLQLR